VTSRLLLPPVAALMPTCVDAHQLNKDWLFNKAWDVVLNSVKQAERRMSLCQTVDQCYNCMPDLLRGFVAVGTDQQPCIDMCMGTSKRCHYVQCMCRQARF